MSPAEENKNVSGLNEGGPVGVLPAGHMLAEFRVERVLGKGGFGVVYLAFDTQLKRQVAVKEFMPQSLAQRLPDHCVVPISEQHRATFELGLRSFVREACSMAHFKHPSLVEVYRFWEDMGTAYMVMPFYEGQTLKQRLEGMVAPPSEPWLRAVMTRVMEGLDIVHQQGWLHRDIAPDNILLLPGDRPVLLDFGSAKHDIGDATQALAGLLKPGYAPFEQYSDSPDLKQGPWTDLYALGALLYFAISGRVPIASVARVNNDALVCAARVGRHRYSAAFLKFIDRCLAVWPEQRPKNISAALQLLHHLDAQETLKQEAAKRARQGAGMLRFFKHDFRKITHWLGRQRALPWVGGSAALCAGLGGLMLWNFEPGPAKYAAGKGPGMPAYVDPAASLPPAYPPSASTAPAVAPPEKAALSLPLPQETETQPLTMPARFASPPNPQKALDGLVNARDPNIRVVVTQGGDNQKNKNQLTIKASEPGFLYVFATGERSGRLELLWPSDDKSLLRMERGQVWKIDALPRLAAGSAGQRDIGVMVSRSARHLTGAGWQEQAGVLKLSFSDLQKTGPAPWFGNALCAPVPGECDANFGATRLNLAYSPPSPKNDRPAARQIAKNPDAPRWRQVAAKKAECESLGYLMAMDGNALAQRRYAQLGCRQ
ncbi:serine/threonine protein kinase [Azohydromonas lata]|uniref:Protein kinase n=1 Tax=Azohydromonas lata TaxID=45677 RepID=A0ABU5IIQ9_9BURK|nr:protein kinase [Azohydromonas lata]MDZ5458495.1 protein kinase [Azohydromonas lata]